MVYCIESLDAHFDIKDHLMNLQLIRHCALAFSLISPFSSQSVPHTHVLGKMTAWLNSRLGFENSTYSTTVINNNSSNLASRIVALTNNVHWLRYMIDTNECNLEHVQDIIRKIQVKVDGATVEVDTTRNVIISNNTAHISIIIPLQALESIIKPEGLRARWFTKMASIEIKFTCPVNPEDPSMDLMRIIIEKIDAWEKCWPQITHGMDGFARFIITIEDRIDTSSQQDAPVVDFTL